jgi:hypothetical protein
MVREFARKEYASRNILLLDRFRSLMYGINVPIVGEIVREGNK